MRLPLFPSESGKPVEKKPNILSLIALLQSVGASSSDPLGNNRFSGHSWRRSGLRMFARAQVSLSAICAVSRHKSMAVCAYLDDLHADTLSIAKQVMKASCANAVPKPLNIVAASNAHLDEHAWRDIVSYDAHRFVVNSDPNSLKVHLLINESDTRVRCPVRILDSPWSSLTVYIPHSFSKLQRCGKCFHGHMW